MNKKPVINWADNPEPEKKTRKSKGAQPKGSYPSLDFKGFIGGHFKPLGWGNDDRSQSFYFFSKSCLSIIRLPISKINRQTLLQLAPLEYWSTHFPATGQFDILTASDFIVTACNIVGYFSDEKIRGRGAWIDGERFIFHAGTHLVSDNINYSIGSIDTEFTYEQRKTVKIKTDNPLSVKESALLPKLISGLNFKTASDSKIITGWLTIAPFCGLLKWRPHIWVTGPRGNGKSWFLEQIVHKMLFNFSVFAQGTAATEPAIRQKINSDAIPVLIDEGEGNNEKSAERMQELIGLSRAASSENSPAIPKGGKDGKAVDYFVRCCFLYVSINPQLINDSDKRRFCVLEIKKHSDQSLFTDLNKRTKELITEDYAIRYQNRTLNNIDKLLKSIDIFTAAVTFLTDDKALGDQYGALFGGWWHSWNDEVVSYEIALEESAIMLDYRGVQEDSDDLKDEERCIQRILGSEVQIQSENFIGTRTIGELIEIAGMKHVPDKILREEANTRLKRLGIKVVFEDGKDLVLILNNSAFVQNILEKSPWKNSYATVLCRLPTAVKRKQTHFSAGLGGRCIQIDLNILI